MSEQYKAGPVMFAAEPFRFMATCAVIIVALILAFTVSWLYYIGLIVAIAAALTLVWWYFSNQFTQVAVTEERIIFRSGIFRKTHVEVERASIRTVRVDQTIIDRLFGCGMLKVYSAGDTPEFSQDGLPDVERLRAALRRGEGN